MKKIIVLWSALLGSVSLLLQGCTMNVSDFQFTQDKVQQTIQQETIEYMPDDKDTDETVETQETEQKYTEIPEMYYAYHKLDENRQKIYIEILDALTDMKEDVKVSTLDKKVIDTVFACVMNDHPELFYVEGYLYTEYTFGDTITGITFSGTYSMTKSEVEKTKTLIEQSIEECFYNVPLNEDEYNTVKYLYEWLINHTEYDKTVDNNQNICSVFLNGKSVCQGYAKAMQYMLQKAGMQCFLVTGFTNTERHAWNLVQVNGEYYYVDPTWGDASYSYNGADTQEGESTAPSINYDYMLVTTDEITCTHSFEKVLELPKCTSSEDNYYVREGLYFDSFNHEQLMSIFQSNISREMGYVTIKCSEDEIYNTMINELISSQKIFDYIDKHGETIAYTSNEKQHTISFWNIY